MDAAPRWQEAWAQAWFRQQEKKRCHPNSRIRQRKNHAARGPAGGDAPSLGGMDTDGEPRQSEGGDDTCSSRWPLLPPTSSGD